MQIDWQDFVSGHDTQSHAVHSQLCGLWTTLVCLVTVMILCPYQSLQKYSLTGSLMRIFPCVFISILHHACNDEKFMKSDFMVVTEGGGAQHVRLLLNIINLLIISPVN